jgi:hypothetical protein
VSEAVEGGLVISELTPGQVALEQPRFEVAGVLGQQLVAEVVGETPASLAERAQDLRTESGDERVVLLRLILPPYDLAQYSGHHVQVIL